MPRRAALLLLLVLLPSAAVQAQSGSSVTVYRCTDASGHQTLRDTPCPAGQKQQTREMLRPKDAPPKPAVPASPAPAPAPRQPETRTVYLVPPMPMYECTTPDGARYTSDDGDGNPRWVPLWTLDYPVLRPHVPPRAGISSPTSRPVPVRHPPLRDVNWPVATGGAWVRDACMLLPPRETCARLRDRRDAIRTRFFNAQEKERDILRIEERGILARLDNDCGGH